MTAGRYATAVEVVRQVLERDDPQLPGTDVRAKRIVDELYDMGLLAMGRRIEAVPGDVVAAWL